MQPIIAVIKLFFKLTEVLLCPISTWKSKHNLASSEETPSCKRV